MEFNRKGGFFMKLLKQVSAIVLTICMLFGVVATTNGSIVAKADSAPVQLYYLDDQGGRYGMSNYTAYVQINSNAAHKEVWLHYCQSGSTWLDKQGGYVTTLPDGSEIWKVTVEGAYGILYTIKFIGDGQVYWANNNGKNFTENDVLGTANIKAGRITTSETINGTVINFSVTVKNIGYAKEVGIRYTTDNWATKQDVLLEYDHSVSGTNNEVWTGSITIPTDKKSAFKFCGFYKVNGNEYWDNNFGANYDINYIAQ